MSTSRDRFQALLEEHEKIVFKVAPNNAYDFGAGLQYSVLSPFGFNGRY